MPHLGRLARSLRVAAAALALAIPSSAYYHYVHYLTGSAPFTPVPEAFDLAALPNKTITFFVSDTGLATYSANDSFGSVLAQVKSAAAVWNAVASSDLRVAFGGLETYNLNRVSTAPGGDVVFAELAPGILGLGTPTVSGAAAVQTGQNGQFIPISRGLVILTNSTDPNAGYGPGASYLEEFYTTAVHEFGHALGLQHTWTAAAMSQDVIRNTSRARPIDADDVAAITELYGATGWAANTGSISGTVTANGQAWNMASVVAIPPQGPAVSALTNPDGTYTINGLTPGGYLLYVHPLPQDAVTSTNTGLLLPVGSTGLPYAPTKGYFQTVFYPGTVDVTKATTFTIAAGQALTSANFTVQPRSQMPVYDIVTWAWLDVVQRKYSYYGSGNRSFISPAYASTDQSYLEMYVEANYLNTMPVPSSATLLGPGIGTGAALGGFEGYVLLYFPNNGGVVPGPHHLVMTFNTSQGPDVFVVPDAIDIVQNGPPAISAVTQNGDGSVTVAAAGLTPDSRVFFDGQQAAVTVPYQATDATDGTVTVSPPPGASGQNATVTVFTADNQNSMLVQSGDPVTYAYPVANAPQISAVTPPALPAGFNVDGTSAMVDITAANTNFVQDQVTVGFGTSDISVRRVWVLSPTHLMADVVVGNNAVIGTWPVNVISGFQVAEQAAAFQVQPPNMNLPTPALPVFNAISYATVLHDADYGSIFGSNLSVGSGAKVLLNGQTMPLLYASPNQINFQIPAGFPVGPANLQIANGAVDAFPVYLQIDRDPVTISTPLAQAVVNPGDVVSVQVTNADAGIVSAPNRVAVTLSGVPMAVQSVTAASGGAYQIQFAVTQSFAGWQVPLVVSVDGSPSAAVAVTAH
ncbi:MAG TPA: matrixin family metalloprotease [Bryobacteraceae bacterium]|nr:matrixin family metalloprotease [Bryobacteraceae bacterium]